MLIDQWGASFSLLSGSTIFHIPEAEFSDKIQTKVLRIFLLAIHSHLYSFVIWFIFLQTHATSYMFLQTHPISYNFYSSVTVHYKEEGGKPDRKHYPSSYGIGNPYRNIKSENSQEYAQKLQRNCTFMNLTSRSGNCMYSTPTRLPYTVFTFLTTEYIFLLEMKQG
jgi:hypothetical protein